MDVGERDAWLQERYARWVDALTRVAFVLAVAGFAAYLFGRPAPFIPIEELPRLWNLPLAEYLARTGAPTGWGWLGLLGRGDYLNYLGLALFALVALVCDLAIIVPLLRRGERLLAALVAAQVVVLAVAASGVVT